MKHFIFFGILIFLISCGMDPGNKNKNENGDLIQGQSQFDSFLITGPKTIDVSGKCNNRTPSNQDDNEPIVVSVPNGCNKCICENNSVTCANLSNLPCTTEGQGGSISSPDQSRGQAGQP